MKNYQTIKKVLFALFLTITLFSFKSSDAQVYARLERENPYGGVDYNPGGTYQRHEWNGYECYMRFYSNSACTIPLILTEDVHCGVSWITYYDEVLNYGGTFTSEVTGGAGQSEVFIDSVLNYDLWYDEYNTGWGLQNTLPGGFADDVIYVGLKPL